MLKKRNMLLVILILSTSVSCSQKPVQIDKLFYEVRGPIKTKTTFQDYDGRIGREVYHFSPKGDLKKIEHYNSFNEDEDVKIGSISYFEKGEDGIRYFYETEKDSKKLIASYTIKSIGKNKIQFLYETDKKDVRIDRIIQYTKEGKTINSITKGHYFQDSTRVQRTYFYDKNKQLNYTITQDLIKNIDTKIYVKNIKMDSYGNVSYAEHHDKDGKILFKWECEYTYYK